MIQKYNDNNGDKQNKKKITQRTTISKMCGEEEKMKI